MNLKKPETPAMISTNSDHQKVMDKAKQFSQQRGIFSKDFVAIVAWRDRNPPPNECPHCQPKTNLKLPKGTPND